MVRKLDYLFEIESEIDKKILSSMIDKLLQCLFKGLTRGPRTLEEALMITDEGWEKKVSDTVKRRLKNKVCILCGEANPKLSFPSEVRIFGFRDTKYKFYFILCYGCNLRYKENAYYSTFSLEDIKDTNIRDLVQVIQKS